MTTPTLLATIEHDLGLIIEQLTWAYHDGYRPEGPRTPGPTPNHPIDPNPDHIHAPLLDIGQGNYQRRETWNTQTNNLARIELLIAAALLGQPQPELTHPSNTTTPTQLRHTQHTIQLRLNLLASQWLRTDQIRYLRQARRELDTMWLNTAASFATGKAIATTGVTDFCRICTVRDRADKAGGRCHLCHAFRKRNGYERPKKLDAINSAREAAVRRRHRGESYGDESMSAVVRINVPQTLTPADGTR